MLCWIDQPTYFLWLVLAKNYSVIILEIFNFIDVFPSLLYERCLCKCIPVFINMYLPYLICIDSIDTKNSVNRFEGGRSPPEKLVDQYSIPSKNINSEMT